VSKTIRIEGPPARVGGTTWYDPVSMVRDLIEIERFDNEVPDLYGMVEFDCPFCGRHITEGTCKRCEETL